MILAVILTGLSGCGTISLNTCTNKDNITIYKEHIALIECNEFIKVSNKIKEVYTIEHITCDKRFTSYSNLSGYTVTQHDVPDWFSKEHGYQVDGLTHCDMRMIEIGNQSLSQGALAHEIAHAIQECDDPEHSRWEVCGINNAIEKIKQESRDNK